MLTSYEYSEKPLGSPLWHKAMNRFRDELDENDDFQAVVEEGSFENIMDYAKTVEPFSSRDRSTVNRLGPIFRFVDDFSAIVALYFGADAKVTTLVWGSIRLILRLSSSMGDTMREVVDMLEDLSLTLPRFRHYEQTLPMDQSFELSATVESEAELARMRADRENHGEVIEIARELKESKISEGDSTKCWFVPRTMNRQFCGRTDVLEAIHRELDPGSERSGLKTFTLYGLGGIGKSQAAIKYAHSFQHIYETVIWISAENEISIAQGCREIARNLGLIQAGEEEQEAAIALGKMRTWLADNRSNWLLILDNVDDANLMRTMVADNGTGSVLYTTRDFDIAFELASANCNIRPFDESTGSDLLLRLVGLPPYVSIHRDRANTIVNALGGLPLAIIQMGSFIAQRKLPLQDFLPLYERNAAKIESRKIGINDYEHTLNSVWNLSLERLEGPSRVLQNLLVFFAPDSIREEVLIEDAQGIDDEAFAFLNDEMDLGDAEHMLLQSGLLEKNIENGMLSMHRLVQAAVMRRLSEHERHQLLRVAVHLLTWGFPDRTSKVVGHQVSSWEKCEKCLAHVHHLVQQVGKYSIPVAGEQAYGELLLRCGWYLYERETYTIAQQMIDAALETIQDNKSLSFASAIDLAGLLKLDMNDPRAAKECFQSALNIRQAKSGSEDAFVAVGLNNIGLAYTELSDKLDDAYDMHSKAIELRTRLSSDRLGQSLSNMASLLLRMGRPDEAEQTLAKCPSLKDFSDETFLKTNNPRFSGDMVLLSRIRLAQGRKDEALRLSSKALAFRRKLLGSKPKTCYSLYDVARMLAMQGNLASAVTFLHELVNVSETLPEGRGQLARAKYPLSVTYAEMGRDKDSEELKAEALKLRQELKPDDDGDRFDYESFNSLCLWMLW
ncbi:MAG: hypothetical protein M1831_001142 [Alyxoria varia]|nr:MAG: hypothetical protein M1831_001142 [Alyxoria varia]